MNHSIINFRITFYLFILFIIRNQTLSYVTFSFPYSLSLSNGNILVIHKTGITICNHLLSKIIKNVIIFENDEQIQTEDSLSKITTTKINNYIIGIINDKIHIFNDIGDLLYLNNTKILSSDETAEYYTLFPYKVENNYFEYFIGFIHNKLLYFLYYKYNYFYGNNYLLSATNGSKPDDHYLTNKALSCQYMIYNYQNDIIVCFYLVYDVYYYLTIYYFSIGNNNNLVKYPNSSPDYFEFSEIKCIKSTVNPKRTKTLVGLYTSTGEIRYFIFDINDNNYEINYIYFTDYYSRIQFHGLKVNYYEEIEQYILSCIDDNGEILIKIFDKNFNNFNLSTKYTECEKIYGYSIIYSNITQKYYIISDVNCNGKKFPINLLYEDMNYEEEKFEKEEEEEEEEEKEKQEEEEKEEEKEKEKVKEEEEEEKKEKEKVKEEEEEDKEEKEEEKEEEQQQQKEKEIEEQKEKEEEEIEEKEKEIEEKKEIEEEQQKEEKEKEQKEKEEHYLDEREIEKVEEENMKEIEEKEFLDKETMAKNVFECNRLEKCQLCNEESASKDLCIKCNNKKEYYFLNYDIENQNYIDCVNNITKPQNFYFNEENNDYEPCFYTCATCDYGGDGIENNCTSCELNYMFKPDYPNSTNCVIKCLHFYYYTIFDQYKCTPTEECPKDYNLMIKDKRKCIDNCQNDDLYKYQYNGECFKECPNNTYYDENEYKCKDINIDQCLLTENKLSSDVQNITDEELEEIAHKYAKEFNYTNNHVSLFKNDIYSITLYKNGECIFKLSLEIPEIDFGICEIKIKNKYQIDENLIIAIITKKVGGISYSSSLSFSFYEPEQGKKLPSKELCQDDNIIVVNNILYKLDKNKVNLDFILYLTKQNINVFNLTDVFYTDICYHFDSPINKDIALNDRILLCFPNISLCDEDCLIKGVNLTSLKSICECKFSDIINNKIFGSNIIEQSQIDYI